VNKVKLVVTKENRYRKTILLTNRWVPCHRWVRVAKWTGKVGK